MDKEEITRAAREAVNDLQLDCEITEINKPIGKDAWCIQFTGSYGQFCDSFHDKEGKENSARVIREKIKRFFLKQRKPTRIVRGRSSAARGKSSSGSGGESNLLGTLLEVGEGAIKQAARIGGEVIERAATVNRTVLETEADWIQTISPTAAEMLRPGSTGTTESEVVPPQRTVEPPSAQTRGQEPSRAFNSTQKSASPSSSSTGKKATTAKKARATKKSKPAASKKSSTRTTKKSAASKRGAKASKKTRATSTKRKKGSGRKKSSSKSKGAIKLLF
ncbi:MAG TPA: hypothetical protein VM911_08945 [Pyrinomonadaceae bacterium]|jgi:hypothetical protein|nr:hypothetical protein [Pyrinomonadaceae bacterium]